MATSSSAGSARGGSSTNASGQVDASVRGAGSTVAAPSAGSGSVRWSSARYAASSRPSVPRAADAASSSSAAVRSARSRPKSMVSGSSGTRPGQRPQRVGEVGAGVGQVAGGGEEHLDPRPDAVGRVVTRLVHGIRRRDPRGKEVGGAVLHVAPVPGLAVGPYSRPTGRRIKPAGAIA